MCRLVNETTEWAEGVVFPSGEGIDTGGYDGTIEDSSGSVWVPAGPSVWELSTREGPGRKANCDYRKRTTDPLGWDISATSYVQVSLRPWPKRRTWAAESSADGCWGEVHALGFADIVAWLADAPETELWLAERLRLCPGELTPGRPWWRDRVARSGGFDYESIVLAGRSACRTKFLDRLTGDATPVTVEAESIEVALEFIAAAANSTQAPGNGESLLERTVFVHGPNAWRRLHGESGRPLLLVACDPALAELARSDDHTSVFAVQQSGGAFGARQGRDGSRDCVEVPRLDARQVAAALDSDGARNQGINLPEAHRLGHVGHGSADALRRQLTPGTAARMPQWAKSESTAGNEAARAKTAALLAGDWLGLRPETAGGRSDRKAIVHLAGGVLDYETLQLALRPLSEGADPMLRFDGSTWRLVAPLEAWTLLAPSLISEDALDRFFEVAAEVLGERDPRGSLDVENRVLAQLRGVSFRFSEYLRYGIARTLALLSVRGDTLVLPFEIHPTTRVRRLVAGLFEPEEGRCSLADRVRRVADLADVAPLLAEAAPVEVVEAIESVLRLPEEASAELFWDSSDAQHPWGAVSTHVAVLAAVERIAWVPGRLDDVAEILLRLEVLDPGGYLAQRPSGSFADVFAEVTAQTGASAEQRLGSLRGLQERLLESSSTSDQDVAALARLLERLIARGGLSVEWSSVPVVRDYPTSREDLDEGALNYRTALARQFLEVTRHRTLDRGDASGLQDVLVGPTGRPIEFLLSDSERRELWQVFQDAASVLSAEDCQIVGDRLSALIDHHMSHPDAKWALPADEVEHIAEIAEALLGPRADSDDPIERHRWLFETDSPRLEPGLSPITGIVEYDEALTERRVAAIREVMQAQRPIGVLRLAELVADDEKSAPWAIGNALARAVTDPSVNKVEVAATAVVESELYTALGDSQEQSEGRAPDPATRVVAEGFFTTHIRLQREAGRDPWPRLLSLVRSTGSTSAGQARLLRASRDYPRAWQEAASLGTSTSRVLWELVGLIDFGRDLKEVDEAARGLLSVGRAADAVDLLASRRNSAPSDGFAQRAELVLDALVGLAEAGAPAGDPHMLRWAVKELIRLLAKHLPVNRSNLNEPVQVRIAQTVISYLWVFDLGEPVPFVHDRLSFDPHLFVEVISVLYRSAEDVAHDVLSAAELLPEERALHDARVSAVNRILTAWQRPPGIDSGGAMDEHLLNLWTAEAQQLLDGADRREMGDHHIGLILAAAPADPGDDLLPAMPIRRLIESEQSASFEDGFVLGLCSKFGGGSGGVATQLGGGDAATRAVDAARSNMSALSSQWRRTRRLLERVVEALYAQAQRRRSRTMGAD